MSRSSPPPPSLSTPSLPTTTKTIATANDVVFDSCPYGPPSRTQTSSSSAGTATTTTTMDFVTVGQVPSRTTQQQQQQQQQSSSYPQSYTLGTRRMSHSTCITSSSTSNVVQTTPNSSSNRARIYSTGNTTTIYNDSLLPLLLPYPITPGSVRSKGRDRIDTGDTTLPVSHMSSSGVVGVRRSNSNRIVVGRSLPYNLPDRNLILDESSEQDGSGYRPTNDHSNTLPPPPPPPSDVGNDDNNNHDDDDDDPHYRETVRVGNFRDWTNDINKLDLSGAAVTGKYAESALPTPLAGNKSKPKCGKDNHDDNLESEQQSSVVDNFDENDGESVFFTSDDYAGKKKHCNDDDDTTITQLFDGDKIGALFNPDSPLNAQEDEPSSQQQQQQQVSIKKSKKIELTADEIIMEQIVAAAKNSKEDNNNNNDGAASVTSSIVSSLSDTISYQRLSMGRFRGRSRRSELRNNTKKGYSKVGGDPNGNFNGNNNSSRNSRTKDKQNKDKDKDKKSSNSSKPASSMSVMATLMFKRGGLRRGFSTRSRAMAPPITPPPSDTNNNHHHVHHLRDTVTTAGTGESLGCHTLETIDKSLEQNLFQQESQRRVLGIGMGTSQSSQGAQSWSRNSFGTKGPSVDTLSLLGAEIDREEHRYLMMEAHRRRGVKKGGPSTNLSSPGWSTQSFSHVNSSLKGGPGDGISSPRASSAQQNVPQEWTFRDERWTRPRHLHYMSPRDESSMEDNSQHHHRRSTSLTSNGSEFGSNHGSMGIKSSWLIPSSSRVQQPSFRGELKPQIERVSTTPASGESLIDVTHDEPIDPFSGLIGMPSSIGCERSIVSGDGESYTGMNVFGTGIGSSSSLSLMETPGTITLTSAKNATYDEFDPLMEDEILESPNPYLMINNYPTSVSSAGIPPRHYKDDPLLSRSRYRSPLHMKKNPSSRHRRSASTGGGMNPSSRHRRSASVGGGMGSRSDMMMENTCMFGSIVLSETTKTPMTPLGDMMPQNLNSASLEWDGSVSHNSPTTAQSTGHSLATPGSDAKKKKQAFMTPSNNQDMGSTANNTLDRDQEGDNDDDNSSFESFSEEYHRAEQKRKIVAKEMKHIIGKVLPIGKPVVKVGRKLLGREKEGGMQRSEGCLT